MISQTESYSSPTTFPMTDEEFFAAAAAAAGDRDLDVQKAFPLPKWVDPKKVRAGQKFVRENFFSVLFAHFISLIFLLCYAPVRKVLVRTQKSETTEKALKRYLSTLVHIKLWYEQDLVHREGPAAQDAIRIRKVHSRVAKNFERRCPMQNMNPGGAISQLDMLVTQFCFMGFISLYPSKFGIFSSSKSPELQGFIHLWAVIGHLLGIEDRFNICLEENYPRNDAILGKILVPELTKGNPDSVELWRSLVNGMATIIPFLNLNAILVFVKDLLSGLSLASVPHLSPKMTLYDSFCSYLLTTCFNSWINSGFLREVFSWLLRLAILIGSAKFLPVCKSAGATVVVDSNNNNKINSQLSRDGRAA